MVKVSFVLPAYKGRFLKEAIVSILSQSFTDFELIVINDHSPDEIQNIISLFDDTRIRYYENAKNIGGKDLVANWNHCLSYATGEWAVLASDDDVYGVHFLKEMLSVIAEYPNVDLVHCRHQTIDPQNKIIGFSEPCLEYECAEEFIYQNIINRRKQVAPDFMFRLSAIQKIGGFVNFPMAWGSDDATWCKLSLTGGVGYTGHVLFSWRSSGLNISTQQSNILDKAKTRISFNRYFKEQILPFLSGKDAIALYFGDRLRKSLNEAIKGEIVYSIYTSKSFALIVSAIMNLQLSSILTYKDKFRILLLGFYFRLCK
ncbi:MAG: glycosyltransferase family A protein [Dysgonamonadaceae bacterium]